MKLTTKLPSFLILSCAVLLCALLSCNKSKNDKTDRNKQQELAVKGVAIDYRPTDLTIDLTGTLIADETVELMSETQGKLVVFDVEEGKNVEKGQLLAKVNDSEQQAQIEKLKLDLQLAEQNLVRTQRLVEIDAVSQQDLDAAQNTVDGLKAQIQLTKAQIEKSEIRAPFSGRIGLRYVSPGSFINTTTPIATLIKDDLLKLEFSVPERYTYAIKKDNPIYFTLGQNPKKYTAQIYATDAEIDQGSRALKVRAKTNNTSGELIPGYFARVEFYIAGNPKALLIPPEALIPVLNGQNIALYKNGRVKITPVEIGNRTSNSVELFSGVKAGDTIITTGLLQIQDSMQVDITMSKLL